MPRDKQTLLKRHRRRKRLLLIAALLLALLTGTLHWALPVLLGLLTWLAHEAWGSDHLFYAPQEDYSYAFGDACAHPARIANDTLLLPEGLPKGSTLLLELTPRTTASGRCFDPHVLLDGERFDFERGVAGKRYLDISGHREALVRGPLPLTARHCTATGEARVISFDWPDFSQQRVLVLAPHADDAELAAFGLYRHCTEAFIVTLTQGEAEPEALAAAFDLPLPDAARLKGHLRSWDSVAIPRWGNVSASHCMQLGYYCMQLASMRAAPDTPQPSRYCGDSDIRPARRWNARPLPGDRDGAPTWVNLVADLIAVIEDFRPAVIVTPHPALDPHPDHVATTEALREALQHCAARPDHLLFYANHLHDNDRWPMGPAGEGLTLPPAFDASAPRSFWSWALSSETQHEKALALALQHDLQGPLPGKKRLRRFIQYLLAGRRWPRTGDNEFFRKAVRRRELFQVQSCADFLDHRPS